MADTTLFKERLKSAGRPAPSESDGEEEYTACSFGRVGIRPQIAITFRKANGSGRSFAYSHLYAVSDENPNLGFIVEFTRHTVTVHGRNLLRIYKLVCDHKARELLETDEIHALLLAESEPVITRIDVREEKVA